MSYACQHVAFCPYILDRVEEWIFACWYYVVMGLNVIRRYRAERYDEA
jgi:hypothetical protein